MTKFGDPGSPFYRPSQEHAKEQAICKVTVRRTCTAILELCNVTDNMFHEQALNYVIRSGWECMYGDLSLRGQESTGQQVQESKNMIHA